MRGWDELVGLLTPQEKEAWNLALADLARTIAEHQAKLTLTGIVCSVCGKPGASSQDEADHNTGDCHCAQSLALCWREWWVDRCQPD